MNTLKQSHLIKVNKNFNSIYNLVKWIFKRCALFPTCFNDRTIITHHLSCFLCPLCYPFPGSSVPPITTPAATVVPAPRDRHSPAAQQPSGYHIDDCPSVSDSPPRSIACPVTTQRKLCPGSKPVCAQGIGKTKGFLRASGQDQPWRWASALQRRLPSTGSPRCAHPRAAASSSATRPSARPPPACWGQRPFYCECVAAMGHGVSKPRTLRWRTNPTLAPEGRVLRTKWALGKHTLGRTAAEGFVARRCVSALLTLLHWVLLLSRFSDEETEAREVK